MPQLGQFALFMIALVGRLGYLGVFIVIGLEYACFPIPSEVVLPFVGMSIPQTSLEFLPTFLVSIVAGMLGSLLCYFIGYYGGTRLSNAWCRKSPRFAKAFNTFNDGFNTYGRLAVCFSRVIPLTRTYISFFAGISAMSLYEFSLYSITGIALWNLILISLGFYLGHNWALIEGLLNTYSNLILVGACIILILWFVHKKRSK